MKTCDKPFIYANQEIIPPERANATANLNTHKQAETLAAKPAKQRQRREKASYGGYKSAKARPSKVSIMFASMLVLAIIASQLDFGAKPVASTAIASHTPVADISAAASGTSFEQMAQQLAAKIGGIFGDIGGGGGSGTQFFQMPATGWQCQGQEPQVPRMMPQIAPSQRATSGYGSGSRGVQGGGYARMPVSAPTAQPAMVSSAPVPSGTVQYMGNQANNQLSQIMRQTLE